jgi:hypothetical protein
MPLERKVEFAI